MTISEIKVGIMDRSVDPPKWRGAIIIKADVAAMKRGNKQEMAKVRKLIATKCTTKKWHIEAVNIVHKMPEGLPPCDIVATILPHEVSKAFAAKRTKSRPVLRGGKQIERGSDVGAKTRRQ